MRTPIAAALLLATSCASSTPHGLVRVDLPGPVSGPGSPQERELAEAVRGSADAEGLVCQPGLGAAVLRCSAGAVGNQSRGVTLGLVRSGSGYEVTIDQPIRIPGTHSPVCDVQRRVLDHVEGALRAPVARIDARSDCKKK